MTFSRMDRRRAELKGDSGVEGQSPLFPRAQVRGTICGHPAALPIFSYERGHSVSSLCQGLKDSRPPCNMRIVVHEMRGSEMRG